MNDSFPGQPSGPKTLRLLTIFCQGLAHRLGQLWFVDGLEAPYGTLVGGHNMMPPPR